MSSTAPPVECRLALSTRAPHEAREVVRREMTAGLPADVADDLVLIVSELVTNGVLHGAARLEELQLGPDDSGGLRLGPPRGKVAADVVARRLRLDTRTR